MLSSADLVKLLSDAKSKIDVLKINNIYIDSSIIDKTPYPSAWMQEDIWPYQRAITPYIIDNNYTDVVIKRSSLSSKVDKYETKNYAFSGDNVAPPSHACCCSYWKDRWDFFRIIFWCSNIYNSHYNPKGHERFRSRIIIVIQQPGKQWNSRIRLEYFRLVSNFHRTKEPLF